MKLKRPFIVIIFLLILAYFAVSIVYPGKWSLPGLRHKEFVYGLDLSGGARLIYEADLSNIPAAQKKTALEGARDVIMRRVNGIGVAEPRIFIESGQANPHLVVELPGVKNLDEALERIGETPVLEFRERTLASDITPQQTVALESYNQDAQKRAEDILKQIQNGADFATLAQEYSEDPGSASQGGDLDWFKKGAMVKEFEEAAFSLQKGEVTSQLVKTQYGYHIIKKIDERSDEEIRASHILIKTRQAEDYLSPWKNTEINGRYLVDAQVQLDPANNTPQVQLTFNSQGEKLFAQVTERNVQKPLAIFLDGLSIIDTNGDGEITDKDLYAPVVQEKIPSGKAVISGNMTLDQAKTIAKRLKSGALPVPIHLISQNQIGPTLGKISLDESLKASLIGFLAIVLFMIIFYRWPGFLASLALIFFAMIMLSLVKMIPVTLTLAGIAGAALSVGMAVDANILIFERMREEIKTGKNIIAAIETGFKRAWPSIRDGNATTLLVAVIMFFFGTSFVKGFAVTLSLGVLTSLFSALVVTHTLMLLGAKTKLVKFKNIWTRR
jgi:preprotein translocase subunit SecD